MTATEIDQQSNEWWKNKEFTKELDNRYNAMDSGADKGVTPEQLQAAIEKRKQKKHGK